MAKGALGPMLVGLIAGAVLLAMGMPRLLAALTSLEGEAVVWEVFHAPLLGTPPLPADILAEGAASLADAASWNTSGEREANRGDLLFRQLQAMPASDPDRAEVLQNAVAALEAGLAEAPAQPAAWAQLAYLRAISGDAVAAAKALRLSLLSGPVAPGVLPSRLKFGLALRPTFPSAMASELDDLLKRQVRLLWLTAPHELVPLSASQQSGSLVREALEDLTPDDLDLFIQHQSSQ